MTAPTGLTLQAYADAKHLPLDYLCEQHHLAEQQTTKGCVVCIPYYNHAGVEIAVRLRTALDKTGHKWPRGTTTTLYGWHRLDDARTRGFVVLCEGESDPLTLWWYGVPALGFPGAATWKPPWDAALDGIATVYLVIEPDEGGEKVLKWLPRRPWRDRVRLVRLGDHKDPNALHGADPEHFMARWQAALDAAEPFVPPAPEPQPLDGGGARLVLPSGDWLDAEPWGVRGNDIVVLLSVRMPAETLAEPPIDILKVTVTSDKSRRDACKHLSTTDGIILSDATLLRLMLLAIRPPPPPALPAPTPIDPAVVAAEQAAADAKTQDWLDRTGDLLDRIDDVLANYITMTDVHRTAVVLWTANTHVYRVRDVVPYLHLVSATPQSGKTRIFQVIEPIVCNGEVNIGSTEAVIFRTIEAAGGLLTLLLDEVDDYYATPTPENGAVRAILRSGYKKRAFVRRCEGENFTPRRYSTFCPKAFAGVRDLLDPALRERCIIIRQQKRREDEPVGDLQDESYGPWGRLIGEAFVEWAPHAATVLADWQPDLPPGVRDRNAELWRPLLAIAELAGQTWTGRCRDAIRALVKDVPENQDVRVLLLTAFHDMFTDMGDKVCSAVALELLIERETEPWGKWWAADVQRTRKAREDGDHRAYAAKATAGLASMLRPFGILPKPVRLGAGMLKGYDRADFEDAFARHLSLSGHVQWVERGNGVTTLAAQVVDGVTPPLGAEGGGNSGNPCGTTTVTPLPHQRLGEGFGTNETVHPPPPCINCSSTTWFAKGPGVWVCGGCRLRLDGIPPREPGVEG
jgi:hypothetical protein